MMKHYWHKVNLRVQKLDSHHSLPAETVEFYEWEIQKHSCSKIFCL